MAKFKKTYTVDLTMRFYDVPAHSPQQAIKFAKEDVRTGNLWDAQIDITNASAQEELTPEQILAKFPVKEASLEGGKHVDSSDSKDAFKVGDRPRSD